MSAELTPGGASLLYRSGEEKNFELPEKSEIVVGSSRDGDIVVRFPGVSRRHARIFFDGRAYFIEDAGSANRTFLNGRRVVRREKLEHLDVVTLGRNTDLIFVRKRVDPARMVRRGIVRAWIERLDGEEAGTRVEIPRGSITMGRSPINNIQTESPAVSKVHARLDRSRSALALTDLHSANGTFLGRERVETCVLKDREVFSLAGARSYRVRIEEGDVETTEVERPLTEGSIAVPLPTDWKTKIEWSPEERAAFEDAREKGRERAAAGAAAATASSPVAPPAASPTAQPSSRPPSSGPAALQPSPPPPREPERAAPEKPAGPSAIAYLDRAGRTIPLTAGNHEVGRAAPAAIVLDAPSISRRHAAIRVHEGRVVVEDLSSHNGTFVGGERITGPRELRNGDSLSFGDLAFTVRIPRSG